jgi:hypothetical protein
MSQDVEKKAAEPGEWLDIEKIATAEISSEDPGFPIDDALTGTETAGWRAANSASLR